MLQTDEAKAEAEYILGNLRTIIKHYGNTTTAKTSKSLVTIGILGYDIV